MKIGIVQISFKTDEMKGGIVFIYKYRNFLVAVYDSKKRKKNT